MHSWVTNTLRAPAESATVQKLPLLGDLDDPQLIQKLQIEESFFKFKDLYNELMQQVKTNLLA
jgi:hypothetical protein